MNQAFSTIRVGGQAVAKPVAEVQVEQLRGAVSVACADRFEDRAMVAAIAGVVDVGEEGEPKFVGEGFERPAQSFAADAVDKGAVEGEVRIDFFDRVAAAASDRLGLDGLAVGDRLVDRDQRQVVGDQPAHRLELDDAPDEEEVADVLPTELPYPCAPVWVVDDEADSDQRTESGTDGMPARPVALRELRLTQRRARGQIPVEDPPLQVGDDALGGAAARMCLLHDDWADRNTRFKDCGMYRRSCATTSCSGSDADARRDRRMSERIAVLTAGRLADSDAKTAHGVIRFGQREVVAVVDARHAGALADGVVPYVGKPTPVVATVREARELGATVLLVGVAPAGGKLDASWRSALLDAIKLGLDVESGLHVVLGEDEELTAAAGRHGVELRELRLAPDDLNVPADPSTRPPVRVVHSVGSDCAIGKMSVTLELDREARRRGLESVFVPTGQTGIAIAGWGIAVDHVISDYIAGAADRLVRDGAARGDLLWVEGQGSLLHAAYSGVTLGLLHGSRPDGLLLCHRARATCIEDYPDTPIGSMNELIRIYESALAWVHPAPVLAIALNTSSLGDEAARAEIARTEAATGVVTDDVVRYGAGRVLESVLARLPAALGASSTHAGTTEGGDP
jgi:uncharacterized NAD-dependent epimerase/dehydratase family protein